MLTEKIERLYPKADLLLYQSGEELLLTDAEPDILLLDIQMSGKNGMETARELRRKSKKTILIFVTALEDFVFQAFDVGAFHYLVKPFDDNKFTEVLGNAVREYEAVMECSPVLSVSRLVATAYQFGLQLSLVSSFQSVCVSPCHSLTRLSRLMIQ